MDQIRGRNPGRRAVSFSYVTYIMVQHTPCAQLVRHIGLVWFGSPTFLCTGVGLEVFHVLDGHLNDLCLLHPPLPLLHVGVGNKPA